MSLEKLIKESIVMKKACFISLALLAIFVIVSCGSSPASNNKSGLPEIVKKYSGSKRPEGVLVGIGMAKLASQNQSRTVAETRARAQISREMSSISQEMIRDFTASSEIDPSAAIGFQEQIQVTLSKNTLTGAYVQDEDLVDGTYYVVVFMPADQAKKQISQASAAAKLGIPAMASYNAEDRMNAAFDRQSGKDPQVANYD